MIGSKLSELRKSNKMSLKTLSEATGISVTFLKVKLQEYQLLF